MARRWGALGNTLGAATLNDMSQQLVNCSAHDTRQPTPISGNARFACELSAALVIRTTACGPFLTASMCAFGSRGAAKLCGALGIGVEVRSNKSDASGTCNESANECELSYRAGTLTSRGGGRVGPVGCDWTARNAGGCATVMSSSYEMLRFSTLSAIAGTNSLTSISAAGSGSRSPIVSSATPSCCCAGFCCCRGGSAEARTAS